MPFIYWIFEILCLPILFILAGIARYKKKPFDIGIGPEPIINHAYHKQALENQGYRVETYVYKVHHITQAFDVRADLKFRSHYLRSLYLSVRNLFHYRLLYISFHGGPLGSTRFLWRFEPFLYRLACIKTVILPYGSDIQEMLRCPELLFRHTMAIDYPLQHLRRWKIEAKIDLWSLHATRIIGGCDWVDYLPFWHDLMLAHFAIDLERWVPKKRIRDPKAPLKILHAPNHRHIKGTDHFIEAVEELRREGYPIEIILLEKVPNEHVQEVMQEVDIIADQLVIGWYAMFALEGMALEKPVLCYLREDLIDLYTSAKLIREEEIPIINVTPRNIKARLKELILNPGELENIGKRSRVFVDKHHSLEKIGSLLGGINKKCGV